MLDIGLEIKILRERLKISSKELAEAIGLSQSQMSRLEKGQRRIDTNVLHRISEALGVDPSFFFRAASGEAGAAGTVAAPRPGEPARLAPPIRFEHLGKLVRSERRRRHLTIDDFATRVGRTKAFMTAFEEGKHNLDADLAQRIARALKLPPTFFVEAQQELVETLQTQVARLDRALAEAHRGVRETPEETAATAARQGVPFFGRLTEQRRFLFGADGQPVGDPEDFLHVPGFQDAAAFALAAAGEAMESAQPPSFREGDIVVFTSATAPRSRDLALVRLRDDTLRFRKVFFEPDGTVRLQPLNLDHPASQLPRSEVVDAWSLALHVARE